MRDEGKRSGMVCCKACGTTVPAYDVVNYGSIDQGYRELCTRCFNAEVAKAMGLERFENVKLQPVVMTDCAGERHEFHFKLRLLGSMVALDAFEVKAGRPKGYQFQILGEPDDEPLSLLGRLVERIVEVCPSSISRAANWACRLLTRQYTGVSDGMKDCTAACLCSLSTVGTCRGTSWGAC